MSFPNVTVGVEITLTFRLVFICSFVLLLDLVPERLTDEDAALVEGGLPQYGAKSCVQGLGRFRYVPHERDYLWHRFSNKWRAPVCMERQCYLWDAAVVIRYSIVHVRWPNVGVMTLEVPMKDLIDCLVFAGINTASNWK